MVKFCAEEFLHFQIVFHLLLPCGIRVETSGLDPLQPEADPASVVRGAILVIFTSQVS